MLIKSYYNSESKIEKAWYKSSNVFYSEYIESVDKNEGDLYVTFNNGATYKYKKVQISPDYVMFKHGGLEGSHGKALNTHIKPKYEFEKMESKDVNQLMKEMEEIMKKENDESISKTYFVSGHRDITETEFLKYKETFKQILNETPDALFIMGDYHGVDIMAQNCLIEEFNVNPSNITVYHMSDNPHNINPNITNLIGGFQSDEERDAAMTANSFKDIAFVRKHTELSGTAQNILRRNLF